MARSKRRMTKSPRGARADWVFRSDLHDEAGGLIDPFGTYEQAPVSLPAGDTNSVGQVLYDSHNYIANAVAMSANVPIFQPRAARAEGGRARILAVKGVVMITPSQWALGNAYLLGMRFGIFEQDPTSGALLVPAEYNMWGFAGAPTQNATKPSVFANQRNWDLEVRFQRAFGDSGDRFNHLVSFRCRRSLRPHEAYGVYCALAPGSTTSAVAFWLRSLVVDEG